MDVFTVIIISSAFFVEACIGFGGGIISVPLLVLYMPPTEAVSLILIFQFLKSIVLAPLNYRQASREILLRLLPGVFLGSIIGVLWTALLPEKIVLASLAVLILIYLVRERFFANVGKGKIGKTPATVIGGSAGWILGAFGSGGPVLVMYLKEKIQDRISFRATLITTFLISNVTRLIASATTGVFNHNTLILAGLTLPFFTLGIYLGQKYHAQINEQVFRTAIDLLLLIAAVSLLFKTFAL